MICPKCNQELPDEAIFCSECGVDIKSYNLKIKTESFLKTYKKRLILLLIIFVMIIGSSVYLYNQSTKYDNYYSLAKGFIKELDKETWYYTDNYDITDALVIDEQSVDDVHYFTIYVDVSFLYEGQAVMTSYKINTCLLEDGSIDYENNDIENTEVTISDYLKNNDYSIKDSESSQKSNEYIYYSTKYPDNIALRCSVKKFIEWGNK